MNLNKNGFTLIEMLAVVVILSILMAIMIPSVNYLFETNRENNYKDMENSIINAAKIFLSDNRYDVSIDGLCMGDDKENNIKKNILSIGEGESEVILADSHLPVKVLVESGNIKTDAEENINNPKDTTKTLDISNSYVLVQYNCKTQDFVYTLEENSLKWQ